MIAQKIISISSFVVQREAYYKTGQVVIASKIAQLLRDANILEAMTSFLVSVIYNASPPTSVMFW